MIKYNDTVIDKLRFQHNVVFYHLRVALINLILAHHLHFMLLASLDDM